MNKPVYLGLQIIENRAIWIHFRLSLYTLYTVYSFIEYMKRDDIYKDMEKDTSNYELDSPLPKGKNKKVIGLMKDELGGKIMTKVVGLSAKTYSYLIDDGSEDKKAKRTKKCVIKREIQFESNKKCLEATQLENKINRPEKLP